METRQWFELNDNEAAKAVFRQKFPCLRALWKKPERNQWSNYSFQGALKREQIKPRGVDTTVKFQTNTGMGRLLSWWNPWWAGIKAWVPSPSTHVVKTLGVVAGSHNPKAGTAEPGEFLGLAGHTAWPAWWAPISDETVSKNKMGGSWGTTPKVNFWVPQASTPICTCTCTHVHTYHLPRKPQTM